MSDNIWKKISYLIGLLPIGALFGLVAYVARVEIKDLDLWLHLAMGKFIVTNHFVPHVDVLSCTIAGQPWINHEWLFQIIVYNIFQAWGPEGLINMQVGIVILTMLFLLFLGYSRERQLSTVFILTLVFLVFSQRFTIRPDIYSLLFFTLYIFVLSLHIDKKWAPWGLFIIQILWSNIHGFFFFGPLFVLIGFTSEWMRRHITLPFEWNTSGRLTDEEYKRIKFILMMVVLACLINPYFIRGALYPIGVFFSLTGENKIFFKYIQELQKPVSWETVFTGGRHVYYKLLIFISFISFVFNRRKIDISALLFWLVFLLFSLQAARNASFFAFAAYLVFITNLINISYADIVPLRFTAKRFQYVTEVFVKLLLLLWIFQYGKGIAEHGYYDFDRYERKSEFGGISQKTYPNKAVDFIVENNIKGHFFNDFNSGAYLLGRAYPNIKVFIDGRTELYGGPFFKKYQAIWEKGNTELFEELAQEHHITGALLNSSRSHIPKKILNYFYQHQQWRLVYFDYDAVIFLKDVPEHKKHIEQYAIDLTAWKPKRLDLIKLGAARVKPYRNYYRAYTLESLNLDEAALTEAQDALNVAPVYSDVYHLVGKIYAKNKDYRQAFESFRIAAMLSPASKEIRYNLALSYSDLEEYEGAIKQYQIMTTRWAQDPKAHFLLSKSYVKNKQYKEALESLTQAHHLDPNDLGDVLSIGDLIYEQKAYPQAKDAYTLALKTNKDFGTIHAKLADVYLALGQRQEAKAQLQKALSFKPDSEEILNKLKEIAP